MNDSITYTKQLSPLIVNYSKGSKIIGKLLNSKGKKIPTDSPILSDIDNSFILDLIDKYNALDNAFSRMKQNLDEAIRRTDMNGDNMSQKDVLHVLKSMNLLNGSLIEEARGLSNNMLSSMNDNNQIFLNQISSFISAHDKICSRRKIGNGNIIAPPTYYIIENEKQAAIYGCSIGTRANKIELNRMLKNMMIVHCKRELGLDDDNIPLFFPIENVVLSSGDVFNYFRDFFSTPEKEEEDIRNNLSWKNGEEVMKECFIWHKHKRLLRELSKEENVELIMSSNQEEDTKYRAWIKYLQNNIPDVYERSFNNFLPREDISDIDKDRISRITTDFKVNCQKPRIISTPQKNRPSIRRS